MTSCHIAKADRERHGNERQSGDGIVKLTSVVALAGGSGYPARMTMLAPNRYAGHRFPLSFRIVEEMLAVRGILVRP